MDIQEFKCTSCGGSVDFNIEKQKIVCSFCGTEYSEEEVYEHLHPHKHDEAKTNINKIQGQDGVFEKENTYYSDEDEDNLRIYTCNSCGGEIIGDETIASTSCPFCNNNIVIPSQLDGELKPDLIIPFKNTKEDAKKALKNFYKGRKLLPKVFEDENHIDEIKPIYVPFWLFSGSSSANIQFKATRVDFYSDSRYRYKETSYFDLSRGGNLVFENVPVDGSSKIDDIMMESIEPFMWNEAEEFSTYYLPGFLANRYDLPAEKAVGTAESRIRNSTLDSIRNSVTGYSSVQVLNQDYNLGKVDFKYALAPVWFLNTKWKGKYYSFAMNGQTGKIVGQDMPIDNGLRMQKFLISTLIVGIIIFLIAYFIYPNL